MTLKGIVKLIAHPIKFGKDFNKKYFSKKPALKSLEINDTNIYLPFTHILHTGEEENGIVHLDLWLPYFFKADIEFIILTRHQVTYEKVKEKYPIANVIYAKADSDIKNLFASLYALKACFYPSNTGNNLHLLQHNHVKHIFIGHGDSDKMASAHKYFRVYDQNWVASQAHIDRFKNAEFDYSDLEMVKVGRPNLKEILEVSDNFWRDRFDGNINLLYLSTWEGFFKDQDYTSIYFIENIIYELISLTLSKIDLKPHPGIGRRDNSLKDILDNVDNLSKEVELDITMHPKEKPVSELIKESNLFICDISAVVSECLASNAPIFVYIPKDKKIKLAQSNMSYEDYTYIFSSVDELIEKLKDVLDGNDYLADNRAKAMEYILGKNETQNDEFIKQLQTIQDMEENHG